MRRLLDEDRIRRAETGASVEPFLNLSPECEQDLRSLQTIILPQTRSRVDELLHQADELQSRIVDLERKLAGVPAQDLVVELIRKRDAAQEAVGEAERRHAETDAELKRLSDEREQKHAKLVAQIEKCCSRAVSSGGRRAHRSALTARAQND